MIRAKLKKWYLMFLWNLLYNACDKHVKNKYLGDALGGELMGVEDWIQDYFFEDYGIEKYNIVEK